MSKIALFIKVLPFGGCLYAGIVSVLEAIFPSLRDPDFNRWELDDTGGSYVKVLGWKKVLTPPRVIAQGYMSDGAAVAMALMFGALFIAIGVFGIRHVLGIPQFIPDPFDS